MDDSRNRRTLGEKQNSYAGGVNQKKISKPLVNLDSQRGPLRKRTLHMQDFKQLKFLQSIEQRYILGAILGQGAFGTVRLCKQIDTRKNFAVKIMQKKAIEKQKIYVELLMNELTILSEKSHPRIMRIIELVEDKESYYIVSEVLKGGELFKRIINSNSFTE